METGRFRRTIFPALGPVVTIARAPLVSLVGAPTLYRAHATAVITRRNMPVALGRDCCDRVRVPEQLERPVHQGDVVVIVEWLCARLDEHWPAELPPLYHGWKFFCNCVNKDRVEFVIVAAETENSSVVIRTDLLLSHVPEHLGTEQAALNLLARVRRKLGH